MITSIRIPIVRCSDGVYLRWWYNGWHYYNFTNQHEIVMRTQSDDIMTTEFFSVISKIERPTRLTTDYAYQIILDGIPANMIDGFIGLLQAEKVEQYEGEVWREVDITRGETKLLDAGAPAYSMSFEVTRKELPNTAAVKQKSLYFYIGETLCDMDESEVIPINKQVNDIAEMQDRQSDFTASFKIRKTRAMRSLFELSGEVGANTDFPYRQQSCKLVQDGIEIITGGKAMLMLVDELYYHVAVYSGNLNFFTAIAALKLKDLLLPSTNHTWNAADQAASNVSDLDYIYPMCEPSNDGGITPQTDDGNRCEIYGGWLWPFIKVKPIFDEIFSAAGYTPQGAILTDEHFLSLFIPIVNLAIPKPSTADYLKTGFWQGFRNFLGGNTSAPGSNLFGPVSQLSGAIDANFAQGTYITPYSATYALRVIAWSLPEWKPPFYADHVFLYSDGVEAAEFGATNFGLDAKGEFHQFDVSYTALKGESLTFRPTNFYGCTQFSIAVVEITDVKIGYGSDVTPANHLPDMTQSDFLKAICNLYGLIPETNSRSRTVKFWNYSELYDNIPVARDWSAYLSEKDDETEFKFGDYAQSNYLRFKDSDDVIEDTGAGAMLIDDETLPLKKDVVQLPFATCDEVIIVTDEPVIQIDFNKYDSKDDSYKVNENIDPRIVRIVEAAGSKTFGIRDSLSGGTAYDSAGPKKAVAVKFSEQMPRYLSLQKMLTKTNLRRAKFNLPAYEVAGFRHYVPVYLRQYKAYFYVNKISNYVTGKLCTIELIEL